MLRDRFPYPFDPAIFFTVRGCENVHIYLWIGKDIGWILNDPVSGMLFGTLALLWMVVLLYNAKYGEEVENQKGYFFNEELYFLLPTFFWLFGNYVWMCGNILYNSDVFRFPASCILMLGLMSIVFYFSFLKKKEIFASNSQQVEEYRKNGLICKFKSIGTWRRYEFVHIFFWLLKDYCWCSEDKLMWLAGVVPTLYISVDFILVSMANPRLFVDSMHYTAQLIWICSNLSWAFIELFAVGDDVPTNFDQDIRPNGRIVASYVLFVALLPIIILYLLWLPITYCQYVWTIEAPRQSMTYGEVKNEVGRTGYSNTTVDDNHCMIDELQEQRIASSTLITTKNILHESQPTV